MIAITLFALEFHLEKRYIMVIIFFLQILNHLFGLAKEDGLLNYDVVMKTWKESLESTN